MKTPAWVVVMGLGVATHGGWAGGGWHGGPGWGGAWLAWDGGGVWRQEQTTYTGGGAGPSKPVVICTRRDKYTVEDRWTFAHPDLGPEYVCRQIWR